jgi:hypothetical protein
MVTMKKKINRIGLTGRELNAILLPFSDPEMPLLETDVAQAIFRKVVDAIYVNNEKIAKDLAKAGIVIPD